MNQHYPSAGQRLYFSKTLLRLCLFAVLAVSSAAFAQDRGGAAPPGSRGTEEDQRACGSDARRLCRQFLNDDAAVLSCFKQNQAKLSRACRAVLTKSGQLSGN
jgi:hypothetical protein